MTLRATPFEPVNPPSMDRSENRIDLHLHTDKSDGTATPSDLVKLCAGEGLTVIAITDHDTINGLEEGIQACQSYHLGFIPGIEISSKYEGGALHILGYGIDYQNTTLLGELKRFQDVRRKRNEKIIDKLQSLGIDISLSHITWESREVSSLGRPHIGSALVESGIVQTMDEAFDQYLGRHGKAFVSKEVLVSAETIDLIHRAGGLAFLAHPATLNLTGLSLDEYLKKLVAEQLDGIEVYSSAHSTKQITDYQELARKFKLLVSGGSDYHGHHKQNVRVGIANGGLGIEGKMVSKALLDTAVY